MTSETLELLLMHWQAKQAVLCTLLYGSSLPLRYIIKYNFRSYSITADVQGAMSLTADKKSKNFKSQRFRLQAVQTAII